MKEFTSLLLVLMCFNLSVFSQEPVAERPTLPQEARAMQSCKKGAVWIKGEWEWDNSTGEYIWLKGHCEVCPRNKTYVPGGWKRENNYWVWVPGAWKKITRDGFRKP